MTASHMRIEELKAGDVVHIPQGLVALGVAVVVVHEPGDSMRELHAEAEHYRRQKRLADERERKRRVEREGPLADERRNRIGE